MDLIQGRANIAGQRIGHRLDRDRSITANRNLAYVDLS
jgi:hypothetical protein